MIQLYYYPSNASMAPHILLEELGVPYERILVDRARNAHKTPEYLKLNPNGLIPVLVDDDLVLYETAAICLYLCDRFPAAGLAPGFGTALRAKFHQWLIWSTNTLQANLLLYFYPERYLPEADFADAAKVKTSAEARVGAMLDQLETQLQGHGKNWFLGETYSAVDSYLMMLCRWTRGFDHPAQARPALRDYLMRMTQRAAVQRTFLNEGLPCPWF